MSSLDEIDHHDIHILPPSAGSQAVARYKRRVLSVMRTKKRDLNVSVKSGEIRPNTAEGLELRQKQKIMWMKSCLHSAENLCGVPSSATEIADREIPTAQVHHKTEQTVGRSNVR